MLRVTPCENELSSSCFDCLDVTKLIDGDWDVIERCEFLHLSSAAQGQKKKQNNLRKFIILGEMLCNCVHVILFRFTELAGVQMASLSQQ